MKFQSDAHIINFDGKPIVTSEDDDTPITLGRVLTMACVNADPQAHVTGEEKLSIYRILQKVSKEGEIVLDVKDITMLKELVGESYSVVIVGPVYDILDPTDDEPAEAEDKSESETGDSDEESDDSSSEVR